MRTRRAQDRLCPEIPDSRERGYRLDECFGVERGHGAPSTHCDRAAGREQPHGPHECVERGLHRWLAGPVHGRSPYGA
jgi:hypothetical protein